VFGGGGGEALVWGMGQEGVRATSLVGVESHTGGGGGSECHVCVAAEQVSGQNGGCTAG
jgi:hypothetical protein